MASRLMAVLTLIAFVSTACTPALAPTAQPTVASQANLGRIKTYLLGKIGELKTNTAHPQLVLSQNVLD